MGIAGFKADGCTPVIVQNPQCSVSDDQLKQAQFYVDQLAQQKDHIKKEDWEHVYITKNEEGEPYLRCCFQGLGPHCLDGILDVDHPAESVTAQEISNVREQEALIRKWIPAAKDMKMDIWYWEEVYCVNFPLSKKKLKGSQ